MYKNINSQNKKSAHICLHENHGNTLKYQCNYYQIVHINLLQEPPLIPTAADKEQPPKELPNMKITKEQFIRDNNIRQLAKSQRAEDTSKQEQEEEAQDRLEKQNERKRMLESERAQDQLDKDIIHDKLTPSLFLQVQENYKEIIEDVTKQSLIQKEVHIT